MSKLTQWLGSLEDETRSPYIIAEIGVNHNGNADSVIELIHMAKAAGADCVKFQVFKSELVASPMAQTADYQSAATSNSSQLDMLRKLELAESSLLLARKVADDVSLDFMATAFDSASLQFVDSLDPVAHKIPSGEITNFDFLDKVRSLNRHIVLSTGMSTIEEVRGAAQILAGPSGSTVLHCVSAYPTQARDANLLSIPFMRDRIGLHVGWSDHTVGNCTALLALALGARIFEKHVTMNTQQTGPDHSASADPEAFHDYVASIRESHRALGSLGKGIASVELKTRSLVRRSWFATKNLQKGHVLRGDDVIALRPVIGIQADEIVVGHELSVDVVSGQPLKIETLKGFDELKLRA